MKFEFISEVSGVLHGSNGVHQSFVLLRLKTYDGNEPRYLEVPVPEPLHNEAMRLPFNPGTVKITVNTEPTPQSSDISLP